MKRFVEKGEYPSEWKIIALFVKQFAEWKCEICGSPHDPDQGRMLTVHHLLSDKSICVRWNLIAVCQRCHLSIQGRLDLFSGFLPGVPAPVWLSWRLPYLKRYLSSKSKL